MTNSPRRRFLQSAVAGLALAPPLAPPFASAYKPAAAADEAGDDGSADLVAIINDTHVGEQHGDGHPHAENLRAAVRQVLELPRRPAAVVINGDLAMSVGTPGDYRRFAALIAPLREAGLKLHLTLGNHDDRENFAAALGDFLSATQFRDHRHNGVIDLRHVRLVLLDSLKETPAAPGRIGDEQIDWLLGRVDDQDERPVVVVAHHNPRIGGDALHFPGGIEDTERFWPELVRRPQFKGHIHGHVHDWTLALDHGVQIINTLASAMVANRAVCTNGWTLAAFRPHGVELTVQTYEPDHPWNRERKWLYWRQPRPGA